MPTSNHTAVLLKVYHMYKYVFPTQLPPSRASPPLPWSRRTTPPAPVLSAAPQLRPWWKSPQKGVRWPLHHRRGVNQRVQRTHQGAAGEPSPQRRRERRARVSLREATRTLTTATTTPSSSHRRGLEDKDRGRLDNMCLNADDYLLDKDTALVSDHFKRFFVDCFTTNIDLIPEDLQ